MYKLLFFLLFLLALTAFSFAVKKEKHAVQIGSPIISGSPILVLNS